MLSNSEIHVHISTFHSVCFQKYQVCNENCVQLEKVAKKKEAFTLLCSGSLTPLYNG